MQSRDRIGKAKIAEFYDGQREYRPPETYRREPEAPKKNVVRDWQAIREVLNEQPATVPEVIRRLGLEDTPALRVVIGKTLCNQTQQGRLTKVMTREFNTRGQRLAGWMLAGNAKARRYARYLRGLDDPVCADIADFLERLCDS